MSATVSRRLLAPVAVGLAVLGIGCGSGDSGPSGETEKQLQTSLSKYEAYLQQNSAKLTHWADTIVLKVAEKDYTKAQSRYAAAEVPYGHLAPVALLFQPLDRRVAGLESEVPPDEYGGFHEIEKALFWEKSTYGLKAVARQLRIDVEALGKKIAAANPQPTEILTGADQVLDGIVADAVWGNAQPWSHTDFTDMAARTEGAAAAFEAVKPLLAEADPELTKQIEAQLRKVFTSLEAWGILAREPDQARAQEPGISFVVYDQVSQRDRWELSEQFEQLAKRFATAKRLVETS